MSATLAARKVFVKRLKIGRRTFSLLREVDDDLTRNRLGSKNAVTKEWSFIYVKEPR